MKTRVTMPRWPALLMLVGAAACATKAMTSERAWTSGAYSARGLEPGWLLTIADGRIDYSGNYGEVSISVPRPDPRPTFNGHRYQAPRLTVDVTHARCNDAMSGQGYADRVMIVADGKTYQGCGGTRRGDWDL